MHVFIEIVRVAVSIPVCLLAVDFLSGVLHWLEDTWTAPGRSALLDKYIVLDNIEHHRAPGRIRNSSYWETNRVCIAIAGAVAAGLLAGHVHVWQAFLICALASQANQVHKWAHMSQPPRLVAWLQKYGILQSRGHHGVHHKSPYAQRFCTYTDFLNPVLDSFGFWLAIESFIERFGIRVQRATPARSGY